jgi:hypothetical protein
VVIRPYIHASPDQRFVFSSFCLQTGVRKDGLLECVEDGGTIMVAMAPHEKRDDGSDLLYGWAGSMGGELVYAYVKHDVRNFPVIPRLIESLDIDRPIVIRFDSVAIRTMMGVLGLEYRFKEIENGRRQSPDTD